MNPAVSPLVSDAVPSLFGASLRMGLAMALLLVAAWVLLRWRKKTQAPTREMEVLDRVFLTRGASAALLRVGKKRLLVGVSAEGVRLLSDLDGAEASPLPAFSAVMAETAGENRP